MNKFERAGWEYRSIEKRGEEFPLKKKCRYNERKRS
jgi:hypothetical protein